MSECRLNIPCSLRSCCQTKLPCNGLQTLPPAIPTAPALLSGRSGPVMKKACDRPGYQLTYAATVWPSLAGKYCRPCASGIRWQKPVKPSGSRSMRSFAAGQLPEAKVRTLYHSGKMINVRTPHWKPATSAHKSHSWHHRTVNSKAVMPSREACTPVL